MNDSNERALWEKQKGESKQAYQAFQAYLKSAKRTIPAVGAELGKSDNLLYGWCKKWNWDKRADAFDKNVMDEARKQLIQDQKDMLLRHIKISKTLQAAALGSIEPYLKKEGNPNPLLMKPSEAKEMLRLATELERACLFDLDANSNPTGHNAAITEEEEKREKEAGMGIADAIISAYQFRKAGTDK